MKLSQYNINNKMPGKKLIRTIIVSLFQNIASAFGRIKKTIKNEN